jgi:hypothetical protein
MLSPVGFAIKRQKLLKSRVLKTRGTSLLALAESLEALQIGLCWQSINDRLASGSSINADLREKATGTSPFCAAKNDQKRKMRCAAETIALGWQGDAAIAKIENPMSAKSRIV